MIEFRFVSFSFLEMDSDDDLIVIPENSTFGGLYVKGNDSYKQINNNKQVSLFSIVSSIDEKTVFRNYSWPINRYECKEEQRESIYSQ